MREDDLEDKMTNVWEIMSGDLRKSVFYEWVSRLVWVIEHEGEYDICQSTLTKQESHL
jgi:hypothetical protein